MHNEPWQVYAENGASLNYSATRQEFAEDESMIMGASHVWLWRRGESGIEVLLQKRATSKVTWPGYYDVSVAGHIDGGESPIGAAVREAKEEIGIDINADTLHYLFSLRTPLTPNEINHVYTLEIDMDFTPKFDDGEVELVEWIPLDAYKSRVANPVRYNMINQGRGYFTLLIDYLDTL